MKRLLIGLLIVVSIVVIIELLNKPTTNIENIIINYIDTKIKHEGTTVIHLGSLFTEFDWDSVTIFEAGNAKQLSDNLGIYNEGTQGGIVFMNGETHVATYMSAYTPFEHLQPKLEFCICYNHSANNIYYETMNKHDSYVFAIKTRNPGSNIYRYIVCVRI